jgi:hypothetical protein
MNKRNSNNNLPKELKRDLHLSPLLLLIKEYLMIHLRRLELLLW